MVNSASIDLVRVSLITTETLHGLLQADTAAKQTAQPLLHQQTKYTGAFANAGVGTGALQRPWPRGRSSQGPSSRFWYYYLGKKDLQNISPSRAWERLVPLRTGAQHLVCTSDPDIRLNLESYAYPHGNGTIATITLCGANTLPDAVDRVLRARVSWSYAPPEGKPAADPALIRALLETSAGRSRASRGEFTNGATEFYGNPFSLTTVIRASGVDPTVALEDGGDIHKALEGWSSLRETWRVDDPASLKNEQIQTKRRAKGTMLFSARDSRVLWFPERSTYRSHTRPPHALGCLHRNFTHAAMQVQSLLGLAAWAQGYLVGGGNLSADGDDAVRNCALVLGLLYGAVADIYQSRTVQSQISDSQLIPTINKLRHHYSSSWQDLT